MNERWQLLNEDGEWIDCVKPTGYSWEKYSPKGTVRIGKIHNSNGIKIIFRQVKK